MGTDAEHHRTQPKPVWRALLDLLTVLVLLYFFLASIKLLGASFKTFGAGFAAQLVKTTSSPLAGLLIGILTTSIIQSSSTTTSMLVGLVAAGTLNVRAAIPIAMGANIGTTVTNTIVALGHITRPMEFRRALSCSTLHDWFNVYTVLALLPLEVATHFLEHSSRWLANVFENVGGARFHSPLSVAIEPVIRLAQWAVAPVRAHSRTLAGVLLAVAAGVLLFGALVGLVRCMKRLMLGKVEIVLDRYLGKYGYLGIVVGLVATVCVQSSSVTTSLMVPLAAAGLVRLEHVYPVTLGANIGTTVTAMLAALAGNMAAVTLAFAHLLFNVCGVVIFYVIVPMRQIPIGTARWMGGFLAAHRTVAPFYVLGLFYGVPGVLLLISRLL